MLPRPSSSSIQRGSERVSQSPPLPRGGLRKRCGGGHRGWKRRARASLAFGNEIRQSPPTPFLALQLACFKKGSLFSASHPWEVYSLRFLFSPSIPSSVRSTVGGISLLCPLLLRPRPSLSSLLVTDKRPPLSSLPFSTLPSVGREGGGW